MTELEAQTSSDSLRVIIVDDEELARKGLEMRLKEFSQVELLGSCANAKEAVSAIIEHEPDLIFLDIQMPGKSGIEMVRDIQVDILPMIIFVTAFDSFAVDAFKMHAVDYLLKPVESERLLEAINKATDQKALISVADEKQKLLRLVVSLTGKSESAIGELLDNQDDAGDHIDRLAIKDGSSITFVPIKDIDWIDAAGDYMCVHVSGETHIMRTTMKDLESKLDPAIFQRVHRSTIVNLQRVEKVSSHINGEFHLTLSCGSSLKMSRSYKEKVKHFF
ncbi:MAG: response regulator transcription factor [Gammaproteobacteria bacterium]|jgi:two-component system LytT family response regulator|nr:response regulator transcription factor [Gammaproteobacteria bacterium]MBT3859057.1 response regulator transcription factor [Gammaproteobacteria bacterium]MBT3987057.1 response regulator transcription factor [Gammaproteobacteria bacterium]MBT4254601.1 response regulator transcription factor [Gammaproteobacteria bacterium]MBT4580678.1 response regulator transcription factor [Gammaproteobacteria bacterium]